MWNMLSYAYYLYIFGEVSRIFAHFLIMLLVFFLMDFKSYLHILGNSTFLYVLCKYFFLVCGLSSHSLDYAFHKLDVFNFNED